ncbi:2-oxoacid:acceptor oxidoreductase subunit alpha [Acidobacteria bacterium AH-259-L09]|nr:2-oxoacid:acceptor oxidoreductase subunit alpha [Acidobacteria bacterium AH-259-L09]
MSVQTRPQEDLSPKKPEGEIVNDFSIEVATVNGSGSQSSNNVLMRAIFQMGIPISGKNLFPSNIAGLPTWFTIRASKDGYMARKKEIDILIAMNPETAREDVENLEPGRVVIYNEKLNLSKIRDDLVYYPIPFSNLAGEVVQDARLKKLIANIVYVGSAAELLGIEMAEVELAIAKWFKGKQKAIDLNIQAAHLGAQYIRDNLTKRDPFRVQRMDKTKGKMIIDGNSACALGSMFAGVSVMTWYPITPASSLGEALADYMGRYRIDPETGKATFAIVQAEDELAALGMAIGAGWAGARAMTATSGPGISLMAEFVGLAYFTEVPVVIFDVQRIGPSTGLPTRTSQGDIFSLHYLSHGDTKHVVLFPASVTECFELSIQAFDLAERLQQPVFVASDLDLGMNTWMTDPFDYPEKPLDRGKVLSAEDLERLGEFARYKDVDGDGIPYRTLPGTDHPLAAYFTRGSGHDEQAEYSERPEDYEKLMDRLAKKCETAKKLVPQSVIQYTDGVEIGVIAYGSTDVAMRECQEQLRNQYGIAINYLRIRALPLAEDVKEFVSRCKRAYVVEQNRDGQIGDLIKLEVENDQGKIRKVLHYKGIPIDARFITDQVVACEKGEMESSCR